MKNAIIDDEINLWTQALVKKGAFVWAIFDSCCSGTMTRSVSATKRTTRRVAIEDLVPESARASLSRQTTRGAKAASGPAQGALDVGSDGAGGLVAIYAAQPYETTFEAELPGPPGKQHGILTYMIAQSLASAEGDFSYQQLLDRLRTLYRISGVMQPTPFVEGSDLTRNVLGRKSVSGPSYFLLSGLQGTGFQNMPTVCLRA